LCLTSEGRRSKIRQEDQRIRCQRNMVSNLPKGMSTVVDESMEVREIRTRW
jgi:hypothetical protein